MLPLITKHAKVKLINGRFDKHLKTEQNENDLFKRQKL